MSDDAPESVEIGETVTFVDRDGEEHPAVVVSPCPDDDYITVVRGANEELGDGYVYKTITETSVLPHPDEWDGPSASETLSYKRGWSE